MNTTDLTDAYIRTLIRPRPADGHKGTFGHALLIAGSRGKMGAALLVAKAAMRTGCGLLTVSIPKQGMIPMLSYLPEAMHLERKMLKEKIANQTYDAIGFGPGTGITEKAAAMLHYLLQHPAQPIIIDADGLTLLSQHKDWFSLLGPQIILTPHPKEFERLSGILPQGNERAAAASAFARKWNCIVVLKGQHTCVATPDGPVYRNTTGNSGMGTAGSGDVLTGIITSLCAQGYPPAVAAQVGVYMHGFAGDAAAQRTSQTGLIASDITDALHYFFGAYEQVQPLNYSSHDAH